EQAHLSRCQRSVSRLAEMIDDLLLLANPGQQPLAPLCIGSLLRELVDEHLEHARRKGVSLELTLRDDPPILAARLSLVRAIGNVLDNAIEMSPPGSTVQLLCDDNEQHS